VIPGAFAPAFGLRLLSKQSELREPNPIQTKPNQPSNKSHNQTIIFQVYRMLFVLCA